VVDHVPERLYKAGELGATPIDFTKADPVEQIVTHHGRLEDAPGLYQRFDQRADGVIKAVLRRG
jgi:threonine dehydrogenase-like Zn-dependent dehydrogenase